MKRTQLIIFFSLFAGLFAVSLILITQDVRNWHERQTASPASQSTTVVTPQATTIPSPTISPEATSAAEFFPVIAVVDGDTFKVDINGTKETVRLVGVNTPESVDPRKPVECMGKEASQYLTSLLTGQSVRLEPDPTQSNRDRYNRLLRFAFLPDGTDVGLDLLEKGYAQEAMYSSKAYTYRESYLKAQQTAKESAIGLWDQNACP